MLFKFASYLLGTNTEQEDPHSAASPTSGPSLTNNNASDVCLNFSDQASRPTTVDANTDSNVGPKTDQCVSSSTTSVDFDANSELIYDECVVQTEDRPERLEDSLHEDDEQWIYITPIRVNKEEQEKRDEQQSASQSESNSQIDADEATETEQFNMMDLFVGNRARQQQHHQHHYLANKRNKLEESWVIHPPACFQVDNTFAIEQHPLENLYIEQPALSVMNASAGTSTAINDDKENKKKVTHHQNNHSNHHNNHNNNNKKRKHNARKNRRLRLSKIGESSASTSAQVQDNSSEENNRTSGNTDSTSVRAVLNTGTEDNGATRRRNSLRVKLAHLESTNSLSAYSGFRRENLLTRPFTIHRKLC